jgi:hypothetical protein
MEHTEQSDIHHTASMNLISASDRMRKIQTRMLALLLENVKP